MWGGGRLTHEGDLYHWPKGRLSVLFGMADIPIGDSDTPLAHLESIEVDVARSALGTMTDPRELLAEMQARCDAATEGPWTWHCHQTFDGDEWAVFDEGDRALAMHRDGWMPDAAFIAAARTDMPRLIAAVRAVLELHRAETLYRSVGPFDVCPRHADDCLEETASGEWMCIGCPSDLGPVCAVCLDEYGEEMDSPCPTVTAITDALIGGGDDD